MEYYIINKIWHFLMRAKSRIEYNMNGWDKETYPVDAADSKDILEAIFRIDGYLERHTASFYLD